MGMHLNQPQVERLKRGYLKFINSCRKDNEQFSLTPIADSSPYALCFAIFGYRLLLEDEVLQANRENWVCKLRENLDEYRYSRTALGKELITDKPYLQLLTFSLSSLSVLNSLSADPLEDHVQGLLHNDFVGIMHRTGVFEGRSQSGNQAMFLCILLIHAYKILGIDTSSRINEWMELHRLNMNEFGFWGKASSMSHLQFQNGYHQYEMFEYLDPGFIDWNRAASNTASLSDNRGQYAPYPGGGACYDYDAVYLQTGPGVESQDIRAQLLLTMSTLMSVQNKDGGFCESRFIRPRSISNCMRSINHIFGSKGRARYERARYALTLLRPKNNRIHTHWSAYSRRWNESNLWDSWFRLLTIARIDAAMNSSNVANWGFINFPGIGYSRNLKT